MESRIDEKNESKKNIKDNKELVRLEELIKKSESELEVLDSELKNLEKQMQQKEKELSEIEAKKNEPKVPKILTRKQLKQLNEKYAQAKEQKVLELKNNIDAITKSEFEKARLMRVDGQNSSESEKSKFELQALQIEIDALEKEISIKNSIFYENQERLRDILAGKVYEDLKLEKLNKELSRLRSTKQDSGIQSSNIKSRIDAAVSQKNHLMYDYDKLSRETDAINLKLQKSGKLLKDKLIEFQNLKMRSKVVK